MIIGMLRPVLASIVVKYSSVVLYYSTIGLCSTNRNGKPAKRAQVPAHEIHAGLKNKPYFERWAELICPIPAFQFSRSGTEDCAVLSGRVPSP